MKKCPNCGSDEFVSDPNYYDVLQFIKGDFRIIRSEPYNDVYRIYCRYCGEEVDVQNGNIVMKSCVTE